MERIGLESYKKELMAKSPSKWRSCFTQIPNALILDERVSKGAVLIFLVLRMRQFGNKADSFPSWQTLCTESRLSRGSINKSITLLEELGYIKVKRENGRVNRYSILRIR